MRSISALGLAAVLSCWAGAASVAAENLSVYTSVNDRKACSYKKTEASKDGPESCEFRCDGPAPGVKTKLLSCYDYEHLFVGIDGKSYSTWEAMVSVGNFSGLANKSGVVEWVFAAGAKKDRANLKGLIVRFQGSDSESRSQNALAVFSLKPGGICWKGNFASNEAARAAVDDGACRAPLAADRP